jgi:hypothetical protein
MRGGAPTNHVKYAIWLIVYLFSNYIWVSKNHQLKLFLYSPLYWPFFYKPWQFRHIVEPRRLTPLVSFQKMD